MAQVAPLGSCVFGLNGFDVLRDHAVPVALIVVDRIAVLRGLAVGAGQGVTVLPEHVGGDTGRVQGVLLPRVLNGAVVVAAVLLEQARLARRYAACAVRGHPQVTPAVGLTPCF